MVTQRRAGSENSLGNDKGRDDCRKNNHNVVRKKDPLQLRMLNIDTRTKDGRPSSNLKALAMDNRGSRLVVRGLADPHLLEGGERRQDGATDPDGVLALRRRNDLDLHRRGVKIGQLLLHAVSNAV